MPLLTSINASLSRWLPNVLITSSLSVWLKIFSGDNLRQIKPSSYNNQSLRGIMIENAEYLREIRERYENLPYPK